MAMLSEVKNNCYDIRRNCGTTILLVFWKKFFLTVVSTPDVKTTSKYFITVESSLARPSIQNETSKLP
jgi:hypothetical protein